MKTTGHQKTSMELVLTNGLEQRNFYFFLMLYEQLCSF